MQNERIQPKSSIAIVNRVIELKSRDTKFHIYNLKQEKVVLVLKLFLNMYIHHQT
jgi:hypothetical protein